MKRGSSGIDCLVGIDKEKGPSSHDVVGSLRRLLGERRVGHAGTLDPLASGVLVMGVGQATRLLGLLTLDDKEYVATVELGSQTTTDDAEGEVVSRGEVAPELRQPERARDVVSALVGEHDQVPPAFSAVSVGGQRAYAQARQGKAVSLEPRHVQVLEAELIGVEDKDPVRWVMRLRVSKGTYVRSLARDLGKALGCGAHLSDLRRTASGGIALDACVSLDELGQIGPALALARCLDPMLALGLPRRELSQLELDDVRCGRRIDLGTPRLSGSRVELAEGGLVGIVRDDRLYGVWRRRAGSLVSQATFPSGIMGVRQ